MDGWTLFGFIILLIVSILVGQDAERRGMSGWGWGLFVFLICIVGLPIYLIVRRPIQNNNPSSPQNQIAASSINTKKCPYCAEIIMAEAIKCKHCGSDLSNLT
jgi:hypothetical protein